MDILFFKLGNRIAGISASNILQVIHQQEMIPFLPVSESARHIVVIKGRPVGIIDMSSFTKNKADSLQETDIIYVNLNGIDFGLAVNKILIVRKVSKKLIEKPKNRSFFKDNILESFCKLGTKKFPVISLQKLLEHDEIKPLWDLETK